MKKTIFLLMLISFVLFPLAAQENVDMEKEKAAIKETAMNYIEGWYEGNAERMAKALHPELHKVGLVTLKDTGKNMFGGAGFSRMVELTRLGVGKKVPKDKRNIKVFILDVFKKTASVKTVSVEYVDYLHLAKFNGQWKIKNVLWEPNK